LTNAITADATRNEFLKIAIGGLVSGVLTPLLPDAIDLLAPAPAMLRLALVAVPLRCWCLLSCVAAAPIRCGRRWRQALSP